MLEITEDAVKKVVRVGWLELQAGAVIESELITKSVGANLVNDIFLLCYFCDLNWN